MRIKNNGSKKKKSFRRKSKENKYRVLMDWWWIQLLLQTSLNFKLKCEFEGLSWELVRSKYEQIFENMSKEYPEDPEKFPNKCTKECITAKLKSIRTGFKKAAEARWKSGGGRVVFMF